MKKHRDLRYILSYYDLTQDDIAELLGHQRGYVSDRIRGLKPWSIDDVYAICDYINSLDSDIVPMPYEKIHIFFPRNGITIAPSRLIL